MNFNKWKMKIKILLKKIKRKWNINYLYIKKDKMKYLKIMKRRI